jgi:TolA-binding protein
MKLSSKFFVFTLLCLDLSACVTTRDQLNAERGIGPDTEATSDTGGPMSGAVKSEDLTPKTKPAVPEVVSKADVGKPETATTETPPMVAAPQTAPAPGSQHSSQLPVPGPVTGSSKHVPAILPPDVSSYSPDELRVEVARLTGEVEDTKHEKQASDQAHQDEIAKSQARIAELEKKLKELQPDAPVAPEGKTPFEAGKDAFLAGNCDEAIPFFTQSIAKLDTGKEAEEATYDRGECYFKKSQFNKAIVDFSHFPEKYQKSPFHPKALLRIAE